MLETYLGADWSDIFIKTKMKWYCKVLLGLTISIITQSNSLLVFFPIQ